MARDRKRAKQRQQRRSGARSSAGRAAERDERAAEHGAGAARAADGDGIAEGAPSHLTRGDLPGSLDHVGDVDEFDAALVRGAGGVPVVPGSLPDEEELSEGPPVPSSPDEEEAPANGAPTQPVRVRPAARPSAPRQHLPGRAIAFLRASWAELQRVQWPDRAQVTQATAVVLGFVAVAGIYFGVADYVAKEIVEAIL